MEYAMQLHFLYAAGSIQILIEQPKVQLGCPENVYIPDFFVVDIEGTPKYKYIDVKGVETPAFKKNKKLWKAYGPCPLDIVKKNGKAWKREVIEGKQ